MAYDIANDILNAARVRLNSNIATLLPVGGELLQNTQPFTQQAFNNAYRKFQAFLADLGFARLEKQLEITFPALTSIDPSLECWIDWNGSFNGAALLSPKFPTDFISPLAAYERKVPDPDVPNSASRYVDMDPVLNGLPATTKSGWNKIWTWRDDKFYFPGTRIDIQMRFRYAAFLDDLVNDDTNQIAWFQREVPIVRCQDPMACFLCAEICAARGQADWAASYTALAEDATQKVFNRDGAESTRTVKTSERAKMRDGRLSA